MASHMTLAENGVENPETISTEFQLHRARLAAGIADFEAWRSRWQIRQASIDALLSRLRESISTRTAPSPARPLPERL